MKLRITLPAAAAVIACVLLFSACDDRVLYPPVELTLTSVKVGGLEVMNIPASISNEDWEDLEYEPGNSDSGAIVVKNWDKAAVSITARANVKDAVITWGRSKGGTRPDRFYNLSMPTTVEIDDLFFFRVENPKTNEVRYFQFKPGNASTVKELAELTIAERKASKIPKETATMAELASNIMNGEYRGQVDLTRKESLEALVAATPQASTARIRYAIAANVNTALAGEFSAFKDALTEEEEQDKTIEEDKTLPKVVVIQDEQGKDITQTHATLAFTDGNILAVEVTAQNDDDDTIINRNYFAFMVTAGRLATINTLTIGGKVVAGKGNEHYQWANVVPGSFASADQPSDGFKIGIQLEDSEGTYEWVRRGRTQGEPASTAFSSTLNPTVKFSHEDFLVFKVHSARGTSTDNRYYRVQVSLLAANFKKHPKSAAYTITSHTYQTTPVTVLVDEKEVEQNRLLIDDQADAVHQPALLHLLLGGSA